jgi:putative transposase
MQGPLMRCCAAKECASLSTPIRSPKANVFAERFMKTVRRECLDHLVICGERHLRGILREYLRHYN